MKILSFLKDIISPKKCYFCNSQGHFFCPKCYKKIPKTPDICYVCKEKSKGFSIHHDCRNFLDCNSVMVLFPYKKLKKLIKDSKYYSKKDVLEDIGDYMGEFLSENIQSNKKQEYIILPIPMNFWRKSGRGYNHADILAKHISRASGISYNTKVLKRVKNTLQQSKLTRDERLSNLDGVFQMNQKYTDVLKNKRVILVDDVVSTGVTFSETLAVINTVDIQSVDCLAIASDTQILD